MPHLSFGVKPVCTSQNQKTSVTSKITTQTLHSFYVNQLPTKSLCKIQAATGWCVFFFFLTREFKKHADGGCSALFWYQAVTSFLEPFLTLCFKRRAWIFPLPCPSLSVNYRIELNQKIWYSLVISTKGCQSSVKTEMQKAQQPQKSFWLDMGIAF